MRKKRLQIEIRLTKHRTIDTTIQIDPEVFNYEINGILYEINVPELKTPSDGEVLLKIPDLWQLCKSNA